MPKSWMAALAALTLVSLAAPAWAQDAQFRTTTLSLNASGEVRAAPDMVTITLGAETRAPIPGEAMRANSEAMNQVTAALRAAGVADRDIQTSGLSLTAQYISPSPGQPSMLDGYLASNTVTLIAGDLGRAGALIDTAMGAGASVVRGVSFGLQDPKPDQDAARLNAVKDLAARADLYAKATGYRVARLVSMNEGGSIQPIPVAQNAGVVVQLFDGQRTSLEGGQLSVRANVSAVYELAR
ncbi:MAG: hypothetical protein JWM33_1975 [Caulobacteraceae bacterium]|nr:hypothetical protein [Caulobacteraceae bacterium]